MRLKSCYGHLKPLIGVVHLAALPGAPGFGGSFTRVRNRALDDASRLVDAGFDSLIVENFGDAPFYKDDVPAATVAAMTLLVSAIRARVGVPVGVNVLRNDALSALSIAAVTEARFVRVNVLTGAMVTDQGIIEGRAAEVARLRRALAPDVMILGDLRVKHAAPLGERRWEDELSDLVGRGGADVVLVTGSRTGDAPDAAFCEAVKDKAGRTPVFIASGSTPANIAELWPHVDGAIVGSTTKRRGRATEVVDPSRARRFVDAARSRARSSK